MKCPVCDQLMDKDHKCPRIRDGQDYEETKIDERSEDGNDGYQRLNG